ncbi:MAG: hypothetical protein BGN99_03440 [Alphaproteobacteria bacterium 65-37]|nr:MAG: hypothetical protein BGN99_03440 [Alphaproteobacteria bacterium 65-37]
MSLFGVDTLDQLKYAIFENAIDVTLNLAGPSVESWDKNVGELTGRLGRKFGAQLLTVLRSKDTAAVAQSLAFLSLKETLVCIDDLERKGRNLSIKDILGLVSHLKEKKGCKIALIYNDAELDTDAADEFKKHHEKVVDVSIAFSPNADECLAAAFQNMSNIDQLISERCRLLKISNIRVIKKIVRTVVHAKALIGTEDQRVVEQLVHTITLFGWAAYSGRDDLVKFAETKRGRGLYGSTAAKMSAEEQDWDALLDSYDFGRANEFDLRLLEGIRAGYFDPGRLADAATRQAREFGDAEADASFESAWRLFHDSFLDNENEVADGICQSFLKSAERITPLNLNGTISLLKDLGRVEKANELLQHYMATRKDGRDFFDLEESVFGSDVTDPDVREAFKARLDAFADERTADQILHGIGKGEGWGPRDVGILERLAADDLYKIFKAANGKDLRTLVRGGLYGSQVRGAEELKPIAERAKEALRRIGLESELNRRRVERFGIAVNAPT